MFSMGCDFTTTCHFRCEHISGFIGIIADHRGRIFKLDSFSVDGELVVPFKKWFQELHVSPSKLINHSQSLVEHSNAGIGAQSSGSACSAGSDSTVSGQVKSVPVQARFLPVRKPAEPATQLFCDGTRCVELVELPPGDKTSNRLISSIRLLTPCCQVGQQPGLTVDNELHDHNLSAAPTSTCQEVRDENKDCESNCSTTIRPVEKQKKCRRNRRERNRMALIQFAYEMLRGRIPPDYLPYQNKRQSRLKILTQATRYIRDLTDLLAQEGDFAREKHTSPARKLSGKSAHSEVCEKLRVKISTSEENSGAI